METMGRKLLGIAGPCSVESEAQIHSIASALNHKYISVLRGGIWKPRTQPGAFNGIGEIGLEWLVDAAKSHQLQSATEVANTTHVEKALKAGVDILWIGARSTVSPFVVQEIADALKGIQHIQVFIKNPVSPDLGLWQGAIERIKNAGIQHIAAIHRGFSSYEKQVYRNKPNWDIALEIKRLYPDVQLICDPSHIAGKAELVAHIAQKAIDLCYDGLMIETHVNPEKALSDKEQQITPTQLNDLFENLNIPHQSFENDQLHQLKSFRKEIDKIDEEIIELLAQRLSVVKEIGKFKFKNDLSIFQPERWMQIVESRTKQGQKINVNEQFVLEVLKAIHKESIHIQQEIFKS
jgi:chorismate mutase